MDPNEKVLSYGDVLIRRSDVELLSGPYWLNDQVLNSVRLSCGASACRQSMHHDDRMTNLRALCKRDVSAEATISMCVQIISSYFEWLTRESGCGNDVLLLSGSVTFLLLHGCEYPI